uniref:Uncharacterized protein n=1 Tax=Panagrolaimus sp. PS1159 TaxID=55785 RepID=A0AC35FG89_9BILA
MGSSESKSTKEEENIGVGGRFTEEKEYRLYKLVDTNSNGGELLPWMRYALNTGDYSLIDGYLDSKLKDFMYNGGKAKLESVAELVKIRNKERNAMLGAFMRKKGKGKSGPNILDDFNQEANQGDLKKALKLLDGGKSGKGDAKYREIVWKLEERGRMGENIVGACLMQGSALHNKLAIKILTAYPKLINDIFISEEYYGLSHLHQAIVNEDPYMTNYLLQHGADINQRCYGAFFCANDQKNGRTDSLEHEYVDLPERTNYVGRTYFGEYPLAFAACTNQKDCYRLLRAKRADPNLKDTNGNTVLHMTVIHENLEMLKLAYDLGAKLQIPNNQSLTPLTLAVKIAKKKMFEQILQLESIKDWTYGEASRVAYPLAKLDTIDQETGQLNENSALYLAAYGETEEHLEMLEGLLENLLQAKWDAFARRHWSISLFCFVIYFAFVSTAFMNRPFSQTTSILTEDAIWMLPNTMEALIDPLKTLKIDNATYASMGISPSKWFTKSYSYPVESKFVYEQKRCHLTQYFNYGYQGYVRLGAEAFVLFAVLFQIVVELLEIRAIGYKRWWQVLSSFPFKILYRMSLFFILMLLPIRLLCFLGDTMLLLDNLFSMLVVVFLIYELFVSLLQFNLLIAMMTRTYELIYRTQKEYKRQWAQVILMTELSLPPKDRLMALLKYSRPIGIDKRKRAFVVTRKHETFSESEKLMKEQQAHAIQEEKRLLLKRRLRDIHVQGGHHGKETKQHNRPETPYLATPMPKWQTVKKEE